MGMNNNCSHKVKINKNYNTIGKMEKPHSRKPIGNYEIDNGL